VRGPVNAILAETQAALAGLPEPAAIDVRVELPDGRSLRGTVPAVSGHVLCNSIFSRVGAKHRLAAWVRLLALAASHPTRQFEALTIGRAVYGAGYDATVTAARVSLADPTDAVAHLTAIVDLYDRGMREPLPIYCDTSAAYAAAALTGQDAGKAAGRKWTSDFNFPKEDAEIEHRLVLDGVRTIDELLAEPPRSDEEGPEWDLTQTSRLGRLAMRLWSGLLANEELRSR